MPLPHAPHNAVIASNHRIHSNHSTNGAPQAPSLPRTLFRHSILAARAPGKGHAPGSGQVVCAARSAALLSALSPSPALRVALRRFRRPGLRYRKMPTV